ncbi:MAG: YcaO-like family protein [Acidimicrobiales bacterium]
MTDGPNDAAQRFLHEHGLWSETECLAEIGTLRINAVRLFDQQGALRAWGLSRAKTELAPTVALSEAIEHFVVHGRHDGLLPGSVCVDGSNVGPAGDDVHGDRLMAWLRRASEGTTVECRPFRRLAGLGPDRAALPRTLVELSHWRGLPVGDPLLPFARYGSSTGWSVEVTERRAILRGAMEIIERDTFSRFLLALYLRRPYPCAYLPLAAAPPTVADNVAAANDYLGGSLTVLDLGRRNGVHVCLASMVDETVAGRIVGKGSAPDPWVASERAVGELCQIYAVKRSGWIASDDEGHLERLRRVAPRFQCVYDIRLCPGELGFTVDERVPNGIGVVDRETWLTELLERTARPVYAMVAELVPGALVAAAVYVPGADRFFLSEHGIEVAPTGDDPLQPELEMA